MASKIDLALPDGVAGCLDWSSGMLFINETYEKWEWFKKLTHLTPQVGSPLAKLAQTITHEHYHFFQITTTGYLFQFACLLHDEVRQIAKLLIENILLLADSVGCFEAGTGR